MDDVYVCVYMFMYVYEDAHMHEGMIDDVLS